MWPLAHCFLSLLALCASGAEAAKREEVVGVLGSSVLLDPKVKVDPDMKHETLWEFSSGHKSLLTIVHHIPGYPVQEPSLHFKSRLQFIPSNGSLVVHGLEARDQGDYILTVDGVERKILQLLLFDKLSEASILTNSSSLGSTIQLTCNVSGDPHGYQWRRDGGEISRHHRLMDGNRTLVIPRASSIDCGMYTCVTTNPVGSVQANSTLILHGFPPVSIAVVTLSIIELVISLASLIAFVYQRCWKMKSDKAVKSHERWLLGRFICNILSLVSLLIALICWIEIKGPERFVEAALGTVSVQLLALILLFTVRKLHHPCIDRFQKMIGFWCCAVFGPVTVIIVSVTFLTMAIHQINPGCDSSLVTWSVFFTTRIGSAMISLLDVVAPRCRIKDRSGNVSTEKGEPDSAKSRK